MGIEATSSSSTVSSTSSTAQVSSASNSDSAKKTTTDSSFKDEMDKVSSKEDKKESKVEDTKSKDVDKTKTSETNKKDSKDDDDNLTLSGNADYSQYGSIALNEANNRLSDNILQMIAQNGLQINDTSEVQGASSIFSFGSDNNNQVSLTQADAQFFINLSKTEDVSGQNVAMQAQNMIANGGDFAEVAQNAKISQTLLNALSNARETNQPLRIDFDQNVSVILRIGQDGALSARFIPGDKAVEQYLRNNIETLKATFRENDLPYSDLSYSNSSKQQNEKRRNKQQQGE